MACDVRAGRGGRVVSGGVRRVPQARYLPIAEHGPIGDLHTVALVGTDGTIDWFCCPRFDSPSVFAAILDADDGGLFRISPECDGWSSKQLYLPDTNVLITRFLMPDRGDGQLRARPRRARRDAGAVLGCRHRRRVRCHRGVLAALAAPPALQRALARDGASLGAHAQAAHVRASTSEPGCSKTKYDGLGFHDLRRANATGLVAAPWSR